jgi:beta-phosphoglucomutase-like phosphatase (HAD superfamily)
MKAVLFDAEGTLIDCAEQTIVAWQRTLRLFGYDISKAELRQQAGRATDEMLKPGARRVKDQRNELAREEGKLYQKEYLPLVRPFAGVPELFRKTRSAGFKIGLATTCEPESLRTYRDLLGVDDMIDAIVCATDKRGKPHPDLFEVCLQKLRCTPNEAIAVGDSPYDALAARSASIEPIGLGAFSRRN